MKQTVTVGVDPELFVFNKKLKQFVSGHDIFPGTKEMPFEIGPGAIQVDGVAFEFNIMPARNKREFRRAISTMIKIGQKMLKEKSNELQFVVEPTAIFDKKYFDSLPPYSKLLGCSPDFCAYTGTPNDPPETTEPFRTGSGHVHVGWDAESSPSDVSHFYDCCEATKELDCSLFLPSLIWDKDEKRRSLYGNIGAFRPKTYGVEYRSLSNKWLSDSELIDWVYDTTVATFNANEGNEWLSKDKDVKRKIEYFRSGGKFRDEDLTQYSFMLNARYGIPVLPEEYCIG